MLEFLMAESNILFQHLRAREIKEEIEERLEDDDDAEEQKAEALEGGASSASFSSGNGIVSRKAFSRPGPKISGVFPQGPLEPDQSRRQQPPTSSGPASLPAASLEGDNGIPPPPAVQPVGGIRLSKEQRQKRVQDLRSKFDRARLSELRAKFNWGDRERPGRGGGGMDDKDEREPRRRDRGSSALERDDAMGNAGREDLVSRLEGSVDDIQVCICFGLNSHFSLSLSSCVP